MKLTAVDESRVHPLDGAKPSQAFRRVPAPRCQGSLGPKILRKATIRAVHRRSTRDTVCWTNAFRETSASACVPRLNEIAESRHPTVQGRQLTFVPLLRKQASAPPGFAARATHQDRFIALRAHWADAIFWCPCALTERTFSRRGTNETAFLGLNAAALTGRSDVLSARRSQRHSKPSCQSVRRAGADLQPRKRGSPNTPWICYHPP
jgi:hypothetical protein